MKNLLLLFIPFFLSAQTHRFIYELHYKADSTKNKMDSAKMVLDISKYEAKFYDMEFLRIDSIRKNKNENWTTNSTIQQLVKRKIGSSIHQNYRDNLFDYFLIESKDEMKWKIIPETKKNSRLSFTKS